MRHNAPRALAGWAEMQGRPGPVRAMPEVSGRTGGAPRGGEGGGSRGEAALAVSHSAARVGGSPLPCARHFLWGTFLKKPNSAEP